MCSVASQLALIGKLYSGLWLLVSDGQFQIVIRLNDLNRDWITYGGLIWQQETIFTWTLRIQLGFEIYGEWICKSGKSQVVKRALKP